MINLTIVTVKTVQQIQNFAPFITSLLFEYHLRRNLYTSNVPLQGWVYSEGSSEGGHNKEKYLSAPLPM